MREMEDFQQLENENENKNKNNNDNDNENSWGWFIDIEMDYGLNYNKQNQIVRVLKRNVNVSKNQKKNTSLISFFQNMNNKINKYFNLRSITSSTLFIITFMYIMYD
jgi:hypothetical protein